MRCTDPRTVGFKADGKTISWSHKTCDKQYATFVLPCGQCLECRLDYARQWAIRCVHEAQMHPENSFITLTYSDEHLKSPFLIYSDFQKFMKRLRFAYPNRNLGCFVTGEYGEKTKRPHWHSIIFGWSPPDAKSFRVTDRGDQIFRSASLDRLWGHNDPEYRPCEVGGVTFESAGYCARYAAKKLGHGYDKDHPYQPISKKSSKHAIGKKWLEKYWEDIFLNGKCLHHGVNVGIPRYYERWFKKNHPEYWLRYVTQVKPKMIESARTRAEKEKSEWWEAFYKRPPYAPNPLTRNQVRALLTKSKFKMLQENLKL